MARANPQIADMNRVRAGETVLLPAVPASPGPLAPGKVWVQMARKTNLEDAYQLLRDYPADMPPIRLVAHWSMREGLAFTLVLKKGFANAAEAKDAIQHLPSSAKLMEKMAPDTIYFTN